MLNIRLARLSDLPLYHEHIIRHGKESGREGDFVFSPVENSSECKLEELQKEKAVKWNRAVTDVGWERCWILTDEQVIYGELTLRHAIGLKTSLHRALLMMGIERSHRSRGFGSMLMNEALNWAKAQRTIDWVQLRVFTENEPAKRLYAKFGFKEVGTQIDLFRVFGKSIDDTEMTLRLK